jgi:tetratricopeptide (TPR) repeat protein
MVHRQFVLTCIMMAPFFAVPASSQNSPQPDSSSATTPAASNGCTLEREPKNRLSACTAAIMLNPTDAAAYVTRSSAHRDLRDIDKALVDLNAAIARDPKLVEAYTQRGYLYSSTKRFELAIADFKQAIALDPQARRPFAGLAGVYEKTGNQPEMLVAFRQALDRAKDAKTASEFNSRAMYQLKLGQLAPALADVSTALKMNPLPAPYYDTRGQIFAAMGRRDEALADLRTAIEINPDIKPSKDLLARLTPPVKVDVAGRALHVPVLPGFCAISENSEAERTLLANFLGLYRKIGAQLLTIAAPCAELQRQRAQKTLDNLPMASIVVLPGAGGRVAVGTTTPLERRAFVEGRVRNQKLISIEQATNRADALTNGVVRHDPGQTRSAYLSATPDAVFNAYYSESTAPGSMEPLPQMSLTALTLVHGLPILVKLSRVTKDPTALQAMLIDAKVAVALLIDMPAL